MIFKRTIQCLGWAAALIGLVMIFFGGLEFLIDKEILGVRNFYNWFVIAPSFFLLAISCFLGIMVLPGKQDSKGA